MPCWGIFIRYFKFNQLNKVFNPIKQEMEQAGTSKKRKTRSKDPILLEDDTNQKQEDDFIQSSSSSDSEAHTLPKKRTIQKNTYYYKKKLLLQAQNPDPLPKKKLKHRHRLCAYCGTNETPMWRRGPLGTGTLCNKCGVKWRHGKILPTSPPPIRQRKKIPQKKTLSAEQKQSLSTKINALPVSKLRHVISIIQDERAFLNGGVEEQEGDMELDLNALSKECCEKLWEYVMDGDE